MRAMDALPDDLDPELVTKASAQLLADAGHFGPRELRVLGRRVLDVTRVATLQPQFGLPELRTGGRTTVRTYPPRGQTGWASPPLTCG